jgi:hypothetical protein
MSNLATMTDDGILKFQNVPTNPENEWNQGVQKDEIDPSHSRYRRLTTHRSTLAVINIKLCTNNVPLRTPPIFTAPLQHFAIKAPSTTYSSRTRLSLPNVFSVTPILPTFTGWTRLNMLLVQFQNHIFRHAGYVFRVWESYFDLLLLHHPARQNTVQFVYTTEIYANIARLTVFEKTVTNQLATFPTQQTPHSSPRHPNKLTQQLPNNALTWNNETRSLKTSSENAPNAACHLNVLAQALVVRPDFPECHPCPLKPRAPAL